MIIKVVDGQYVSGYNRLLLELDNPTVEFPLDFLREDNPAIKDYGVEVCRQLIQPVIDNSTQNVREKDPEFIDGEWVQDWIVAGKTAEEKRLAKYNPSQFMQLIFASASFNSWIASFPPFQQAGFADAATNAKIDDNWTVVQSVYDQFKVGASPSNEVIKEWQDIADNNGIPITF